MDEINRVVNAQRAAVIEAALGSVYARDGKTRGTMVQSLAAEIDRKWDGWADSTRYDGRPYELHMCIWNWYAGGGTAEIAAGRVLEAVAELDRAAAQDSTQDCARRPAPGR